MLNSKSDDDKVSITCIDAFNTCVQNQSCLKKTSAYIIMYVFMIIKKE